MSNHNIPANPAPRLVGRSGEYRDNEFYLKGDDFLIGRSFDCHLVLNDALISARHAKIVKTGEQYELQDLNSTNGTFVNDEKIEKKTLRTGDRIKFGSVEFEFLRPIDVSRTIVATPDVLAGLKAMESARHGAASPAPPSPPSSRPAQVVIIPPARQKRGLWGGLILGLIAGLILAYGLSLLAMLAVHAITVHSAPQYLKNLAVAFPGLNTHEGWMRISVSDLGALGTLLGVALGPLLGGLIAQIRSRRRRPEAALGFSVFYVVAALAIQIAVSGFRFADWPRLFPPLAPALGLWGNFAVVCAYFFVVVFVLSFVGTLLVRSKASE